MSPTVGDLASTPGPTKILIYGPAGGGKTAFALTAGPGAIVLDMDGGLLTGVTLKDKHLEARRAVEVIDLVERDPKNPTAFARLDSTVTDFISSCPYWCVILDSFSSACEASLLKAQRDSGWKSSGSGGYTQGQYGTYALTTSKLLDRLQGLPKVIIVLAHDGETYIDDEPQVRIFVPGQALKPIVPRKFDEIWYLRPRMSKEDGLIRELVTSSTQSILARTRLQVPTGTNVADGLPRVLRAAGIEVPDN